MSDLYTAIVLATVFILLIAMADVIENRLVSKKNKVLLILLFALTGIACMCEWIGVKTNGASASLIWLHKTAKVTEFCVSPAISMVAAIAFGEAKKSKIAGGLLIAHTVFEVIALFNNRVFSVDSENLYHREDLYWVYILAFSAATIYCFVCIVHSGKKYQARFGGALILIICFLTAGIGVQMLQSDIRIDFMCVAMGNILLYNYRGNIVHQVDPVTRLLNRICYEKNIENMKSPAIVLIFDVNKFKSINDTYGHVEGDKCLRSVAQVIFDTYGKYGFCYRIGGDEFCVIMYKHTDKLQILNMQFEDGIKRLNETNGKISRVAFGYAYYDENTDDINKVIEQADEMMYNNKG